MNDRPRQLRLGYVYNVNGEHWAAWRHPEAPERGAFDREHVTRAAVAAEQAKFDFFFLGDGIPGDIALEQWFTTHNALRLEPFTLLSRLAAATHRIGLVGTAHTTFYDPFVLARITASLDWLSDGRFGLNAVLGASDLAARNYSLDDLGGAVRYERGAEFLDVIRRLWRSTSPSAYVNDKERGLYIDGTGIHRLEWQGAHFSVAGALPIITPPQGQIPVLYAGASPASREVSARFADVNFTQHHSKEASRAFNEDVRARAAAAGRDAQRLLFLPGVIPILGDTRQDAVAYLEELNELIPLADDVVFGGRGRDYWFSAPGAGSDADSSSKPGASESAAAAAAAAESDVVPDTTVPVAQTAPAAVPAVPAAHEPDPVQDRNLAVLSARVGVDLTALALDSSLPPRLADRLNQEGRQLLDTVRQLSDRVVSDAGTASGEAVTGTTVRVKDLLWASLFGTSIRFGSFPIIVGTAQQIADTLEEWFRDGAADGYNVFVPSFWSQSERITHELVPELVRRGLFRSEYTGTTLRDHLGV